MVPFQVDPSLPIYRQVVDAYAAAIGRGELPAGTALPSVRTLAARLRVNVNTVQKAYRDLEGQGLVQSRPGLGVFVCADAGAIGVFRAIQVAAIVDRFVVEIGAYGVPPDDAAAMVRQAGRTRGGAPHGGGD